jgi:type I restriction enzyme S subunit
VTQEVARRISVIEEVSRELSSELRRATTLRQSILKRAFEGKLVPQDSNNESGSALLEQIRSEREATVAKQTPRKIAKRVVSR